MNAVTPTAKAIWWYLYSRHLEGKGAATRNEIITELDIDAKSCREALRLLREKNAITSAVMHRATEKPDISKLSA